MLRRIQLWRSADSVVIIQYLGVASVALYSKELGLNDIRKKVHRIFCKFVTKGTERCYYKFHFVQLIIEIKHIV